MQLWLRNLAGRDTLLVHVRAHVLHVAQLVAHGFAGFLLVGRAVIAGLGVKVAHGGPSALARTKLSGNVSRILQVHVAENDVGIATELPHGFIPCGGLLFSSTSSSAGDESDKHGLAAVDGRLDLVVDVG